MTDLCIVNQFQCPDLPTVESRTGHLSTSVQEFPRSQAMMLRDASSSGRGHAFYKSALNSAGHTGKHPVSLFKSQALFLSAFRDNKDCSSLLFCASKRENCILQSLVFHVVYLFGRHLHKWA